MLVVYAQESLLSCSPHAVTKSTWGQLVHQTLVSTLLPTRPPIMH